EKILLPTDGTATEDRVCCNYLESDIHIATASDWESWPQLLDGCLVIEGNIEVEADNTVEDLTPLLHVVRTTGDIWVHDNPRLKTVDGLQNLAAVGGFLRFHDNPALTAVQGIDDLRTIGIGLDFWTNDTLETID